MSIIPILIYIFIFALGAIIGSFLNVVILRLKKGEDFVRGRSYCPKCKHTLSWYENIPILSFIFLKGKCLKCKQKISWQYILVEIVTGGLFVLAYFRIFDNFLCIDCWFTSLNLIFYWLIISWLIIIFVYDAKYGLILDKISMPAIGSVFVFQIILNYLQNGGLDLKELIWLVLAGVIIGGFFALQFVISKGKWIGGGDIRLGFLMGLILGWPKSLLALCLAYVLGSFYALPILLLKKKQIKSEIAFGTFLSLATLISLLWGGQILNWYINLIGY